MNKIEGMFRWCFGKQKKGKRWHKEKYKKGKRKYKPRGAEERWQENLFQHWTEELDEKYQKIERYFADCLGKDIFIYEKENLYDAVLNMEKKMSEGSGEEDGHNKRDAIVRQVIRDEIVKLANEDWVGHLILSLNSLNILRDFYQGDEGFVPAINVLQDAVKCIEKELCYITQEEYGRITLPLQEAEEQEKMEQLLEQIEEKINQQSNLIKKDADGYFTGIYECFGDNYIRQLAGLMWYYAWKKPCSVEKFTMAEKAYNRFTVDYKNNSEKILRVETILARIYAKNQIGGIENVRSELDYINEWLEIQISLNFVERCCILASGFAWMDLYELEREVLKKLVEAKLQLPAEIFERLSFLESGGTFDVKLYMDVPKDKFYFDSSAAEWKNTEYDVFFRKAAMKKVELGYSLVISKWTKTLPLVSGQKVDSKNIYAEFEKMVEDFDGTVTCEKIEAQAINLENLEYENAVLFRFNGKRNRCVSMLFASEKYGKNLNITILTLFTPENGIDFEELQKYAMAIKENVYVESFKESILQSVDEVIKVKKTVYEEEIQENKKIFE